MCARPIVLTQLRAFFEAKLAAQCEVEQTLLQKISSLDGGAAEAELQRQRHTERIAESAARRMQNMALAMAWQTWAEYRYEQRQKQWASRRLLNMALAHSWRAWIDMCEEREHRHRLLTGALTRLTRPVLASALTHWRSQWEAEQRQRESGWLQGRIAELEAEVAALRGELDTVREGAASEQRTLRAQVIEGQEAAERQQAEARQAWTQSLAERALRRVLHQQQAMAWSAWASLCEEAAWIRRCLHQAVARMSSMQLGRGWGTWVESWEEGQRARQQLLRVAHRLAFREVARAWASWDEHLRSERRRRRLHSAIGRMRHAALARGWNRWVEMACERRRRMQLLAAASSQLRHPGMVRAFGWMARDWQAAKARAEARRTAERAVGPSRPSSALQRQPSSAAEQAFEAERSRLQHSAWAAEEAAREAREEVSSRLATIALQQETLDELRAEQSALRGTLDETVRSAAAAEAEAAAAHAALAQVREESEKEVALLRARLGERAEQLDEASHASAAASAEVGRLTEQLHLAGLPLAEQERRVLVQAMQARMESTLAETVAANSERIRELSQLIALRDRQLSRALARAASSPKALDKRALRPSSSTGLLVAPALPEASRHKPPEVMRPRAVQVSDDEEEGCYGYAATGEAAFSPPQPAAARRRPTRPASAAAGAAYRARPASATAAAHGVRSPSPHWQASATPVAYGARPASAAAVAQGAAPPSPHWQSPFARRQQQGGAMMRSPLSEALAGPPPPTSPASSQHAR